MTKNNQSSADTAIEYVDDISRNRGPRIRSAAYPSYTIEWCAEFTKKFHQNFGNATYNLREEIAKVLRVSVGHIQTQLSSSAQYGLIEMKPKVGYKPSGLFLRVYKPIDEQERIEALKDALLNPELYHKLIEQFQGKKVPGLEALSTILFRNHNIAEAASKGAAEVFLENLKFLNLLDEDNNLLLDRTIGEAADQAIVKAKEERTEALVKIENNKIEEAQGKRDEIFPDQPNFYPIIIPLKNMRQAKLVLPSDFTGTDLDKVVKFIEALRE